MFLKSELRPFPVKNETTTAFCYEQCIGKMKMITFVENSDGGVSKIFSLEIISHVIYGPEIYSISFVCRRIR